jgi:hypothetical protein
MIAHWLVDFCLGVGWSIFYRHVAALSTAIATSFLPSFLSDIGPGRVVIRIHRLCSFRGFPCHFLNHRLVDFWLSLYHCWAFYPGAMAGSMALAVPDFFTQVIRRLYIYGHRWLPIMLLVCLDSNCKIITLRKLTLMLLRFLL